MRCVVFELAGGHICAPPGRAKVAQTPGRARDMGDGYEAFCQTRGQSRDQL